jgi:flagellar protein FlbD
LLAYKAFLRGIFMIEVTKLNDVKISINAEIIEMVEEVPDTVVTLTTGKKIFVKESRQKIENLVKSYKRDIFRQIMNVNE